MPFTLKQLRNIKGLSQKEAAEKLGVSEPTLANYEKGLRQPNVETIKKMMALYDTSFDDIVFLSKEVIV